LAKWGTIEYVPRNVVTLVRRTRLLPIRRSEEICNTVAAYAIERYRARVETDPWRIEIDFPKRVGGRPAKEDVAGSLDRVVPGWRRVLELYPTEDALGRKG
jgi:hypothetical protein